MKVSGAEILKFEEVWFEALGGRVFLDDDMPEIEPGKLYQLEEVYDLALWVTVDQQGPEAADYVEAFEKKWRLEDGTPNFNLAQVFKQWRKIQLSKTVLVEVPNEDLDELVALIKSRKGWKVLG